jgi:hypothetical protein
MRAKAAGTAARPDSPHTHRARSNPPVSAAAAPYPCWASVCEYEAAMDDATATPIAPPKFCAVLSSPDATPASRPATPARAPIEVGMKVNAVPRPATKNGAATSRQKDPCAGACAAHSMPAPMSAMPAAMTSLGEVLVTSRWDRFAQASEVTDAVIQAAPVARAENLSTCCM